MLSKILQKVFGSCLLATAIIFAVIFTGSINVAERTSGPLNLSPSMAEWLLIVVAVDSIAFVTAFLGFKLLKSNLFWSGLTLVLTGLLIFWQGFSNHLQQPPLEGLNDTGYAPAPEISHWIVYGFVLLCWIAGMLLIGKGVANTKATTRN